MLGCALQQNAHTGDILDFQIFLLFITGKLEILKEIATAKKELPKFYRTWAFLL